MFFGHDELINARLDRLLSIDWGKASAGPKRGKELLFSYYERLLPVWPASGGNLMPNDASIIASFASRLSVAEIAELKQLAESVFNATRARGQSLVPMMASLVRFVLICAALRARGRLDAGADPSEPLLELFEAGYELNPTHGAVDLLNQSGMTSIPLPTRAAIQTRAVQAGRRTS